MNIDIFYNLIENELERETVNKFGSRGEYVNWQRNFIVNLYLLQLHYIPLKI